MGGAIGAAILVLIIILFVGTTLINDMPATFTYTVSVKGLDKYNGGLATDILVPIPMINGEQVFSDDELQYRQFGTWKSMLVVTPQGKMLAFQSISRNLTDIDAQWFREIRGKRVSVDILRDLLSPKTNQTAENITRGINYTRNGLGYPSQVYIDDVIKPIDGTSGNITFDLAFFVYEGMYLGFTGNTYEIRVSEEIPAGMTRMIPVQVQVGKYTECRLGTSEICLI